MSCQCSPQGNPCCPAPPVSADNETLSSSLENFITAFFGSVTKSVVNGAVVWTLPCNLEEGLPANPRLPGEGVSCYLLRLIDAGIVGLTGPQGPAGAAGADGSPGFTNTSAPFLHPGVGNSVVIPVVDVGLTPANPGYVYVPTSGYYEVTATVGNTLAATLLVAVAAPSAVVAAGTIVLISGAPGPQGATGPVGPAGPQGNPGADGGVPRTSTSGSFVVPAVGATVTIFVLDTDSFVDGEPIFIADAGAYSVVSVLNGTSMSVRNYGAFGNEAPGVVVNPPVMVAHSGVPAGFSNSIRTVAVNTNLLVTDWVVAVNAVAAAVQVNLPEVTAQGIDGLQLVIKKVDASANLVTVAAFAGETIDGAASTDLVLQYDSITVVNNGTGWYII